MKTLILGGIRSGKSRLAEHLAIQSGLPVTYLATATVGDTEMAERIAAHQIRRPGHWTLVEEPLALATAMQAHARHGHCLIVDCLTLWLTNLLLADQPSALTEQRHDLMSKLSNLPGEIILVSNETNMGIVPLGELSRKYCDEAGRLHQNLAIDCDRVVLAVAGLPHIIKGPAL